MGKKKDKKAAKAAKAAPNATHFAVPDELLKQGAALLDKANSPAGREMIAAGLTMAAAAASAALVKRGVDKAAADAAPGTAKEPVLAEALNQAADALMKRFLGPKAG